MHMLLFCFLTQRICSFWSHFVNGKKFECTCGCECAYCVAITAFGCGIPGAVVGIWCAAIAATIASSFPFLHFPSFFPCARSLAAVTPFPDTPRPPPLSHPMSWPYHMGIPMGNDFLFLFLIKLDFILLSYVVCSQIWLNYLMDDRHFSCITKFR